jgi:Holliday junction resolvase RusA-like endonuclease
MSEGAFEHERSGANAGLNPMFGDWQHRFKFAPVPYGDGGAKRAAFRKAIQTELENKFFYNNEVRLEITLHLDVQTVLETSETADLDNYAKAILDGLKGPGGILLDDSQVQTLAISWNSHVTFDGPCFDISISSSPDDFMLKPISFFEMPDGLWYPHARRMWSDGGDVEQSNRNHYAGLLILEVMSTVKARGRHLLRQAGMDRLRAYQQGMYFSSSARGFHKSRIDPEFDMHDRKSWRAVFESWRHDHQDEIMEVEKLLVGVRDNYARLTGMLAGKLSEGGRG